ncbi:ScbA/BarX family gamma-butyrolactone biosynthesis protein [Streptomyces nigra]|uniref:ScbA/BarX family gamma-butyrolactone biosynthesis protein n=1 Tax=Streptomyces nigra TaxID=1827580 RepID=UPI00364F31F8
MPPSRPLATTPLAGLPTAPNGLTATVPRQLVHRASVAETFLTGAVATGADRFDVFAEWPRTHQLLVSPDRSAYQPLLVAETVRQAGTLLAHTAYDVPLGHRFVLHELAMTVRPALLTVGTSPAEPLLRLAVTDVTRRGGRPAGFRYEADVLLGATSVATARVAASWTSEAVYRRLRGGRSATDVLALPAPPGLPPAVVGRASAADVVLAPAAAPGRWRLRVDTGHAVFFDHPLDHVPGMLLLEAACQVLAANPASHGRTPVSFACVFHRYAELDLPTWMESTRHAGPDGARFRITARQKDSTVFECGVGTEER